MSLLSKTINAVGWTTGAKFLQQVFQFGLSVFLMRMLGPEAFGLIGMVLVFSGFAAIFSELGFSAAIVQRQDLQEKHRATAFWINVTMAAFLAVGLFASAPLIAKFYREPKLLEVARWLSLNFLLTTLGMVPRALLQKAMRFDVLAKIEVGGLLLSGIVAALIAMAGGGIWSLVAQQLVGSATSSILALAIGLWRPSFVWSADAFRELLGFGAGLTGFNIINYWARSADTLLIGKIMGSEPLGLYSRAYSLMLLPLTQVISVLAPVMFPALSSIQGDKPRVRRAYLRVMNLLTFLTFPMMIGLIIVADPFVEVLFGPKWSGSVPLIQILAVVGMTQTLCNPTGWIYTSQGRTDWLFWWGVGGAGTLVGSIFIGTMYGTTKSVALAYMIGNLAITLPCLAIPGRLIGMSLIDVWKVIHGNLFCACVMGAVVFGIAWTLPPNLGSALRLLILMLTGIVTYGAIGGLFRIIAFEEILTLGGKFFSSLRRTPASV